MELLKKFFRHKSKKNNLVEFKLRIIDRENKFELRKLSEAAESIKKGGSSDLIDI